MPDSIFFSQMIQNIQDLESELLAFDGTSQIELEKRENQLKLRNYIFLAHAEFETFIEEWATHVYSKCYSEWTQNSKILPSLHFLILFSLKDFKIQDNQKSNLERNDRILQILDAYLKKIRDNHGVKRKNILELFIPIGVNYSDLDETKLESVNSYGEARGKHIHNSFFKNFPSTILDKNSEINEVKNIISFLKDLDDKLQKLPDSIPSPL